MDPYELALRRELGLDVPVEEEGWDPFQPIRTAFGATQGSVTGAVQGLMPEAYAAAQAENRTNFGVDENSPWYEKTEALPGAGDVGAQFVPESVRESLPGRIFGPVLRLGGNILGDPTTYTPAILGKAAGLLAKGTRGAEVLSAATQVAREIPLAAELDVARGIPIAAEEVARAVDTARKVGIGETARAIAETSPLRSKAYLAAEAIKEAEPWAMGTAAAVAYGPQVVESAYGSAKETLTAAGQGDAEQAAVSGANAILMAGLGGLMGKGLIDTARARRTITQAMADQGIMPNEAVPGGPGSMIGPKTVPDMPNAGLAEPTLKAAVADDASIWARRAQMSGQDFQRGEAIPGRGPGWEEGPVTSGERQTGFVSRSPYTNPETIPEISRPRTPLDDAELAQVIAEKKAEARALALEDIQRGWPEEDARAQAAVEAADRQAYLEKLGILPGLAEQDVVPTALPRPPAAQRPKGTWKQADLDLGEGTLVKKPPTVGERAARAINLAADDPEIQARLEAETKAGMRQELEQLARSKTGRAGLARERDLFNSADMNDPEYVSWYNHHRAAASEKLRKEFEGQIKKGLDVEKQLLDKAEARRVDAEERLGMQGEIPAEPVPAGVEPAPVPVAPVAAEPAPTMAPAGVLGEPIAPEPVRPTPGVSAPAEPVLAAPVESAPAVEPVRPPSTPVDRMGRTPEQWAESVIRNEKNPEVKAALVANQGALVERIRKLHEGDRAAKAEVQIPYTEEHARKGAYLAKGELTAELLPGKVRGKKAPAPVPAKVEAPVVEAPVEGGPVVEAGPVVGAVPAKRAFKTEVQAGAAAEGKGLAEHAKRWLTILHPHLREQGLNIEGVLKPFVDREVKLPGNPSVKLTGGKAAEFAQFMNEYERALGDGLVPAKARDHALKVLAPDEAVRKGLRNRIGAIEKLLSTEVMEATKQAVAKEKGVAVPETAPVVVGKDRSPAKLKQLAEAKVGLERGLADWIGKAPEARSLDEVAALLGRLRDVATEIPASLGSGDIAKKLGAKEIANIGMHLFPEQFASAIKNKEGLLDRPKENGVIRKGLITKLAEALGVKLPEQARAETPAPTATKKVATAPEGWAVVQRREGNVVRHRSPEGLTAVLERGQDGRFSVDFEGAGKAVAEEAATKTLDGLMADPNVSEIRNVESIPKPEGMKTKEWGGKLEAWRQKQEKDGLLAPEVRTDNPDAPIVWRKVQGSTKGMEAVDELSRADRNRVNSLPREQLSVRAEREMARAFDLAESEGLDLGDGMRAVNHHDHFGWGYVGRVASISKGAAAGMKQIFDKLVGVLSPKTKLEFGGLTMSPHLSGLFREAAGGKSAKVYGNLAEAVYRSRDYPDAVSRVTHMLGHEVAHLSEDVGDAGARIEHGYHFDDLAGYVDRLVKTEEWQRDAQETLRKAGFTEEVYGKLKGDLADQFREARDEVRGQDWRQGAAAVEGVPAGAAEGRAATQPSLLGRGAEAAAGDRAHGLQRGGAVHGGGAGPAGGVRPGAAALEGRPEGVRRGEAQGAGSVAGRGRGEAEAYFAGLESRDQPESVDAARKAIRTLNELIRTKAVPITKAMRDASEYAVNLSEKLSDAEIADVIKAAPDPRGRPGVRAGGLNMLVEFPNMPDRAKARMILFQDFMDEAGETARSHVQHWDEVEADVRDMLGVKSADQYLEMMRHRGGGVTAFDVMALRTVRDEFVRRTNRLDEMWKTKANAGDEAGARAAIEEWQVARNNEAAAIFTLSEKLTGAARALGIARAKGLEGDPQAMAKAVIRASILEKLRTKIKDSGELNRKTDEMVAKFYDAKGDQDYGTFLKAMRVAMGRTGWRAGFDKVLEFFKAGLLGWPSEVANITSNNLFRGSRFLEDTIAAGLDAGYSKLSGKPREVFLGEAAVAMRAARRSLMEGMPELMKAEMNLLKLQGGDLAKVMESGAAIDDLMMMSGAIGGKMGNFLRFHFDSMQAWDTQAKLMSRTDTLSREIYRGLQKGEKWLTKRTKTGEKMVDSVERILGEIRENQVKFEQGGTYDNLLLHQSKPLFEKANEIAKRDTFQAELGNLGKGVQSILREHPALQFLFPFYRTPTNILKETLTRTPYGFFKAWQKRGTLSRAEMVGELAKPVMGSALMALIMAKASEGEITGGGPLTFEEREALQATGWQPYSIRVGDQWISYARLEPIASLMGMAADAVEGMRAGDFQAADTGLHKAMTSISANLTNKTFLSGLTSLTGAIGDPKREMGSFLKQIQQSAVPNSLGFVPFGHLARALDPVYRQTDPASLSVFQAKIPGMSQMLPPAYGPTGEVRTRPGTPLEMLISPFARRAVETGPKAVGSEELVKLGAVPKAPIRYWTSPQGFRVDLRPEERQLLAKALQDATELIGQRIVKDPSYQRLPKDEMDPNYRYGQKTQKDVLEGVVNRARSRALRQIMPSLKQRSRQAYEQREL